MSGRRGIAEILKTTRLEGDNEIDICVLSVAAKVFKEHLEGLIDEEQAVIRSGPYCPK